MADDPWHYSRDGLAQAYFDQFDTRLTHASVLFGPRRTGKTEFLLKDLGPLAQANGWRVAYVSLWQSRLSPLATIIHALAAANKRGSLVDRADALATTLRPKVKIGASELAGAKGEIELDLSTLRGPPAGDQLLHLDDLIDRFAPKAKRALLLFDEAQELAVDTGQAPLVAALRTSLDKRKDRLAALFTGSSRQRLQDMFGHRDAPFFQFAAFTHWPQLDDGFVDHMVLTFARVVNAKLDRAACIDAFHALDRNPFFFRKMLELLAFDPARDVPKAMAAVCARVADDLRYPETWAALGPLQRALALSIAEGVDAPFAQATLARIGARIGGPAPTRAQAQAAIRHLMRAGIISRTNARGGYAFDDPQLSAWMLRQHR